MCIVMSNGFLQLARFFEYILPWMSLNFERRKQEVCTPHAEPAEVEAAPKPMCFFVSAPFFLRAVFASQSVNVVHNI